MQVIENISELREIRRRWKQEDKVIAFVPTMGNLHDGHLQLVRAAKAESDIVIVSIFVNPLQFGPDEDLDAYPRTIEEDKAKLAALGVTALFLPKSSDIYPRGLEQQTFVEVPGISYMICGASRPGTPGRAARSARSGAVTVPRRHPQGRRCRGHGRAGRSASPRIFLSPGAF